MASIWIKFERSASPDFRGFTASRRDHYGYISYSTYSTAEWVECSLWFLSLYSYYSYKSIVRDSFRKDSGSFLMPRLLSIICSRYIEWKLLGLIVHTEDIASFRSCSATILAWIISMFIRAADSDLLLWIKLKVCLSKRKSVAKLTLIECKQSHKRNIKVWAQYLELLLRCPREKFCRDYSMNASSNLNTFDNWISTISYKEKLYVTQYIRPLFNFITPIHFIYKRLN